MAETTRQPRRAPRPHGPGSRMAPGEKAKDFNLLIVPGTGFGCPGHTRISYCVPTERAERSLDAFAKLAASYNH